MYPTRLPPNDASLPEVLHLIQASFAFMDGRIDPPSSIHQMTLNDLKAKCDSAEVWSIGAPPFACVILTPKSECLYIGKLSVAPDQRGKGVARHLIDLAEIRARALTLPWLELEVRIELTENQETFQRLGFRKIADCAHKGYDRTTSYTMRKAVT
jgi:ribosomal protein S18 acetylase RimI-like enzyme